MTNKFDYQAITNAAIQSISMGVLTVFNIYWGMYIVMGMLSILTLIHMVSAALFFSGTITPLDIEKEENNENLTVQILLGLLYLISCYFIYIMGFVFFAGVFSSQVIITIATNTMRILKS